MVDQETFEIVKNSLSAGKTVEEIRQLLEKSGYSKEEIESVLPRENDTPSKPLMPAVSPLKPKSKGVNKIIIISCFVVFALVLYAYFFILPSYKDSQFASETVEKFYNETGDYYEWSVARNEAFLSGQNAPVDPYGDEGNNCSSAEACAFGLSISEAQHEMNSWFYSKLKYEKENPKSVLLANTFSMEFSSLSILRLTGISSVYSVDFDQELLFRRIEPMATESISRFSKERVESFFSGKLVVVDGWSRITLAYEEELERLNPKKIVSFSSSEVSKAADLTVSYMEEVGRKIREYKSSGDYSKASFYSLFAITLEDYVSAESDEERRSAMDASDQLIDQSFSCSIDSDCFENEQCLNKYCRS